MEISLRSRLTTAAEIRTFIQRKLVVKIEEFCKSNFILEKVHFSSDLNL